MPERVKRLSRAVEGSVVSFGVGDGGESGKNNCNGVVVDHSTISKMCLLDSNAGRVWIASPWPMTRGGWFERG